MEKILVIEDDQDINRLLRKLLEQEGYQVVAAFSGTEGDLRASMEEFDLMLCDLMLPGMSGEELIGKVRESHAWPIIALTAKGALDDKVNVLGLGADDYMTKPFEPREMLARVKAQLRRAKQLAQRAPGAVFQEEQPVVFREIVLKPQSMTAEVEGQALELTAHEFDILRIMMEAPGRVFSKEALYEAVWKNGYYGEDNTISVHISNIRKKIAVITPQEYISTVWGIGYKLNS